MILQSGLLRLFVAAELRAGTCAGGYLIISHPMGRSWHEQQLRASEPEAEQRSLPDEEALRQLLWDLPLRLRSLQDEQHLYLAVLQVPCKCHTGVPAYKACSS